MSFRSRILEYLEDIDLCDLADEVLLEILLNHIKSLEKSYKEDSEKLGKLESDTRAEKLKLLKAQEKLRSDPMYGASGEYFFGSPRGTKYKLFMSSGKLHHFIERVDGVDYHLTEIPCKDYYK